MTQNQKIKIDKEYFETVIAYNSIYNPRYLGSIIDHFDIEYFENPDIKNIMPLVVDFFHKRNSAPSMTEIKAYLSTEQLKNSYKNLLISFKSIENNFNEEELLQNTETFLRERAVFKAIKNSASKFSSNTLEVSEILPEFEKACNISLVDEMGFNYFESIDTHCQDIGKQVETLPTGWKWLDERIGGGFLKDGRQLIMFAGRTNIGKSIFLGNMALNIIKQNKKVLLITLEMPEVLYAKRFSSQITKIPLMDLHKHVEDLKATVINFKSLNSDATLYIKEFAPKSVTVSHINAFIKKLQQKGFTFDAIVIDYINLIKPNKITGNTYDELKTVSEHLRGSSYIFNVPIITATQYNRKALNDEKPTMEATSESIGMSYTADLQISIWASEEDKTAGLINIGLEKNRYGPANEYTSLAIDYNTLILKELNTEKNSINIENESSGVESVLDKLTSIEDLTKDE